jgi:hypothetical protein
MTTESYAGHLQVRDVNITLRALLWMRNSVAIRMETKFYEDVTYYTDV